MKPKHYICINPSCAYSLYNDAERFFTYHKDKERCVYCNNLLFSPPKAGVSHAPENINHLFYHCMKIEEVEELIKVDRRRTS